MRNKNLRHIVFNKEQLKSIIRLLVFLSLKAIMAEDRTYNILYNIFSNFLPNYSAAKTFNTVILEWYSPFKAQALYLSLN